METWGRENRGKGDREEEDLGKGDGARKGQISHGRTRKNTGKGHFGTEGMGGDLFFLPACD